jgi:hypothetical protein
MYEPDESIYCLIPPEEYKMPKGSRYKSKFDPKIVPTASTFGNHTTSKVVGNMKGDFLPDGGHHTGKADATWGKPKGGSKPDPNNFTKKLTGTMRLPEKRKYHFKTSFLTNE